MKSTDWDAYYRSTPHYTSVTRKISQAKISRLLRRYGRSNPTICEIGGANSCFLEGICADIRPTSYHVDDLNEFGLSLLERKRGSIDCSLTYERSDVLDNYTSSTRFDIVYSVGLIEHFHPEGTARAVVNHFARCNSGGVVLITFPTPTVLYRTIRRLAEKAGKWSFPDERPLHFSEVTSTCERYGIVLHKSINWAIGLTQGYLVYRMDS